MSNKFNIKKNQFGFYQISPTPSSEEITHFYAQEFYTGEYKNFNDSSLEVQVKDKEFFEARWSDVYNNCIEVNKNIKNEGSVLDVGCGWAQALLYFKEKGLDCYGFDPAKEAVDYGCKKGLNIKHAGLEGMNVFNNKKFDIVTMFNVLEHLADPVNSINQIKEILNPKGILVIDVPNEFNDFQTAGRDVHGLTDWWVAPPNHLNYFSKDSLVNFLETLGFVVKITEASFPLEMFLLFGENYVKERELGSACHKKRVLFEQNLRKQGKTDKLKKFYRALADLNLGRQITVFCELK
ncbi:class I SAM-dependent methyltransferase [Candidatus Pelagibacter sp.]|nr:class I SAM-dependent methyltransferase [Candidatus Pelagibacter sp.]